MLKTDEDGFIWQDAPSLPNVWAVAWAAADHLEDPYADPLPQVRSYLVGRDAEPCPRNWVMSA